MSERSSIGEQTTTPFATIEEAIEEIRQGKMVVVCDDEDRENEGDLTLAAQFATPEAINFMAKEGRGLICLSLTSERCDELGAGPDGGEERVGVRDAVHRLGRGARGRDDRASPRTIGRTRSRSRSIRRAVRATSFNRATYSRSRAAPEGSSSAPARPRQPSISRGSRG